MTVFFPLDTARLRLQGKNIWTAWVSCVNKYWMLFLYWFVRFVCVCVEVDEKRRASSTPAILAEIIKEEGLWVTLYICHRIWMTLSIAMKDSHAANIPCLCAGWLHTEVGSLSFAASAAPILSTSTAFTAWRRAGWRDVSQLLAPTC